MSTETFLMTALALPAWLRTDRGRRRTAHLVAGTTCIECRYPRHSDAFEPCTECGHVPPGPSAARHAPDSIRVAELQLGHRRRWGDDVGVLVWYGPTAIDAADARHHWLLAVSDHGRFLHPTARIGRFITNGIGPEPPPPVDPRSSARPYATISRFAMPDGRTIRVRSCSDRHAVLDVVGTDAWHALPRIQQLATRHGLQTFVPHSRALHRPTRILKRDSA